MRISVKGSRDFQMQIIKFHQELSFKILSFFPNFKSLSDKTITIKEDLDLDVLGKTKFSSNEILINTDYLMENEHVSLREVYGHELAHAFSTFYFMKNIGHGQEWQDIMRVLKLPIRESAPIQERIKPAYLKANKPVVIQQKNHYMLMKCECMFGNTKKIDNNINLICHCCGKKFIEI